MTPWAARRRSAVAPARNHGHGPASALAAGGRRAGQPLTHDPVAASYADAGYFGMYAGCTPSKVRQVLDLVRSHGGTELLTSHVPGEGGPAGFYARLGFVPRGDLDLNYSASVDIVAVQARLIF